MEVLYIIKELSLVLQQGMQQCLLLSSDLFLVLHQTHINQ
jgi:hypothetical protein